MKKSLVLRRVLGSVNCLCRQSSIGRWTFITLDRGGGQVVSVLAFNSDDPIRIPQQPTVFFVKFVIEKNKNKQKNGQGWPIF